MKLHAPAVTVSLPSAWALKLGALSLIAASIALGASRDAALGAGTFTVTTPDTAGDVGFGTSLALDSSGFPVIAYTDFTNGDLKIMHCNDATCSGGNESTTSPDTNGRIDGERSLVLDASGFPVVAYFDAAFAMKVMHCNDVNCAGGGESFTAPDSGTTVDHTSLRLDASGFPVVAYHDFGNADLKLMRCNDVNCAGLNESITSPDTVGAAGDFASLALDGSGFPVIAHRYQNEGQLKVVHCNDANCAGGNESITAPANGGGYASLRLEAYGFPVISHEFQGLHILHCNDVNCAGANESDTAPDPSVDFVAHTSLVLSSSGFPVVSYQSGNPPADLTLLRCNDANCAGGDDGPVKHPDTVGDVGHLTSLALDGSGSTVISYYHNVNQDLHVARSGCPDYDGDALCDNVDLDDDSDGCADLAEQQAAPGSELSGGRRDYHWFWDFYDVPTGAGLARDGAVSSPDIFGVIGRFNSSDTGPGTFDRNSNPHSTPNPLVTGANRANYHPAYDRGGQVGGDLWDLGAANGSVSAPDIFSVLAQFNHACT